MTPAEITEAIHTNRVQHGLLLVEQPEVAAALEAWDGEVEYWSNCAMSWVQEDGPAWADHVAYRAARKPFVFPFGVLKDEWVSAIYGFDGCWRISTAPIVITEGGNCWETEGMEERLSPQIAVPPFPGRWQDSLQTRVKE